MNRIPNGIDKQETLVFFIDGTNICYWKDTNSPTLQVLLELAAALKRERNWSFYCIFDANTLYKLPPEEREIYQQLLEQKEYFYQITGGKRADDFILELANSYDAPVISNDNYNDPKYAKYAWKERDFTPKRLFMGEVIPIRGDIHLILSELSIHLLLNDTTTNAFKKLQQFILPQKQKYKGKIKFFNAQEGWGIIGYETDIYFQRSGLYEVSEDGSEVEFSMGNNEKGPFAEFITPIPGRNKKNLQIGIIEQYDEAKTTGTIRSEETSEMLFFYKSYFDDSAHANISKGMIVEYVVGQNKNGLCAKNIRPAADNELRGLKQRLTVLENTLRERDTSILQLRKQLAENNMPTESNLANRQNGVVTDKNVAEKREQQQREQREREIREKEQREQQQRDREQREVQQKEQQQRDREQREAQQKEQQRSLPSSLANDKQQNGHHKPKTPLVLPKEITNQEPPVTPTPIPAPIAASTPLVNEEKKVANELIIPALSEVAKPATKIAKQANPKPEKKQLTAHTKGIKGMDKLSFDTPKNITQQESTKQVVLPAPQPITTTAKLGVLNGIDLFDVPEKRRQWWNKLEPQWQKAFNVLLGKPETQQIPTDSEIKSLFELKKISFHRSSRNKLSFKLTNLSGVKHLTNLEMLNVSEQEVQNLSGLAKLQKLAHLNCSKTKITTLNELENCTMLEELSCANNQLTAHDILLLERRFPKLHTLDCKGIPMTQGDKEAILKMAINSIKV